MRFVPIYLDALHAAERGEAARAAARRVMDARPDVETPALEPVHGAPRFRALRSLLSSLGLAGRRRRPDAPDAA